MNATNKYIAEHTAKVEDLFQTRRQFLQRAGMGFGALGLAALMGDSLVAPPAVAAEAMNPLSPKARPPKPDAPPKRAPHPSPP